MLTLWFTCNWSWLISTESTKIIGSPVTGKIFGLLTLCITVVVSVSLICLAICCLARLTKRYKTSIGALLVLPVFALTDMLVAWAVTIVWLGPQGSIDSTTPIASPALLLIHTPIKYASRMIGFYGLSAIVWTILYFLWHKPLRRYLVHLSTALLVLSLVGWGLFKPKINGQYRISVVNESLSVKVAPVVADKSQLVIFPEYGFDGISNSNIRQRLQATSQKVYFISSRQIFTPNQDGHINQLVFGNTHDGIVFTQAKQRLVPNGEDASYISRFLLRVANQKAALGYFDISRQVIKGRDKPKPVKIDQRVILGSAICSSITAPQDYRQLTKSGATILTNSASLDIFNGSKLFTWQQKSLASFMAVANARPFVQSTNDSASFALSSSGSTVGSITKTGVLTVKVSPNSQLTLYTLVGEWLVWSGGLVALYALYIKCRRP